MNTGKDILLLTSVDPVKATLLMSGWEVMAAPAVGPYPGRMLTTPGGKPAWQVQSNHNNDKPNSEHCLCPVAGVILFSLSH